jgi:hypothetical protein
MLVKNAISHYLDNYISLSKKDISASAKSREWFLTRIENVINARRQISLNKAYKKVISNE